VRDYPNVGRVSSTKVDSRNRVQLTKQVREISGIEKGREVILVPSKGTVLVVALEEGETFAGSLSGFAYREEDHEASTFLFRKQKGEL